VNKETLKLFEYMVNNPEWINRIKDERNKTSNYKDFQIKTGLILVELLETESQFYDYPRNDIEIKKIVDLYF
jgi:hypothetical protein